MIDLQSILVIVSETCKVKLAHIISNSRRAEIVDARSLYIYFGKLEGYTAKQISKLFAQNERSIDYHLHRVRRLVVIDKKLRHLYADCSEAIKSYKGRY